MLSCSGIVRYTCRSSPTREPSHFPAARNTASGERRSPPGHRLVWPCSFRAERRMSNGTSGGRWNRTSGCHSRHIAGFSPARIPRVVSRHIRLDPSLTREALGKSVRADSERFFTSRKFRKWRNTLCISRFWNCTDRGKEPLFSRRGFIQRFPKGERRPFRRW